MQFRNAAPYALEVPSLGVGTIVEPGEVVDVTDPDVAEGMTGQAVWRPVREQATPRTPRPRAPRTPKTTTPKTEG